MRQDLQPRRHSMSSIDRSPERNGRAGVRALFQLRGLVGTVGRRIDLGGGTHRVGHDRAAEVCLRVRGVSRRHARLEVSEGELVVEDLGSTNGTRVDGERVRRRVVPVGAELRFGPVRLRVSAVDTEERDLAIVLPPSELEAGASEVTSVSAGDTGRRTEGGMDSGPDAAAGCVPELRFPSGYLVGAAPAMRALYLRMRPVLRGGLPVLIHGETGVGKEVVARLLHHSSELRDGPFEAVNCAAIPDQLLEAELFGIGRGVATGVEPRPGRFRLAAGGTLFLDEIGEMSPGLQAKLLRVLQEREIRPLGARAPQLLQARVVAATNVDLDRQLAAGALRRDLYYRLAGVVLEVPPLRRRTEDLPGLVELFLRRFVAESGIRVRGLTAAALQTLCRYSWPGNVRELEHEVRRWVYAAVDGEVIREEHLGPGLAGSPGGPEGLWQACEGLAEALGSPRLASAVEAVEEFWIRRALERAGHKKVEASRLLGLSRNGLDNKMKRLGIEIP